VRTTGGAIAVAFSAGVCAENFADTVACGFAPVTVCTDLLRPTGYRRLPRYLKALVAELERTGARSVEAYVAARAAEAERDPPAPGGQQGPGRSAGRHLAVYAARVAGDPRYQAGLPREGALPERPPLGALDCAACNRCTLVCPNGALFSVPAAPRRVTTWELRIAAGTAVADPAVFETRCAEQWILLADFCNACGNCDTFCPEAGGPHHLKPRVHGSRAAYRAGAPEDGILIEQGGARVRARFGGVEHRLERVEAGWRFDDGVIEATLDPELGLVAARARVPEEGHTLALARAHALRLWVEGSLAGVNPVSAVAASGAGRPAPAGGTTPRGSPDRDRARRSRRAPIATSDASTPGTPTS
jgi:putative selenate reductase